jgi:hypothetical protein
LNVLQDSNRIVTDTTSATGFAGNAAILLPPAIHVAPEAVYGGRSVMVAAAGTIAAPQPRDVSSALFEGFFALGLIFMFFMFSRYMRRFLSLLLSALFNFHVVEKQFKENSLLLAVTLRVSQAFAIFSLGFAGWILYPVLINENWGLATPAPWFLFFEITGGIAILCLLKAYLTHVVGYVGKSTPTLQLVMYFGRLHLIACGFLMFPAALLVAASSWGNFFNTMVIVSIAIACTCFLLYVFRVIQIFFNANFSFFFLILYLCTFEIAPFLLIYSFIPLS